MVSKRLEDLVKDLIWDVSLPTLHPNQFTYRQNRSKDDTLTTPPSTTSGRGTPPVRRLLVDSKKGAPNDRDGL